MQSISTKTGDTGKTGLANGERLSKSDQIFAVLGDIDELNSWLGICVVTLAEKDSERSEYLKTIQETLFYLGADLARSPSTKFSKRHLVELEARGAQLQASLEDSWLTKFLLPGGSLAAAQLDIARTVCRRAERQAVTYSATQKINPLVLRYLNRLSDFLYLLRCHANASEAIAETPFIISQK